MLKRGLFVGGVMVSAGLLVSACTPDTQCEYYDEVPTGNAQADLARCWQGIGEAGLGQDPAFLVVYDFESGEGGGDWREVQSANRLYPNGTQFLWGYQFTGAIEFQEADGGTPVQLPIINMGWDTPDLPLPDEAAVDITPTSLNLYFLTADRGAIVGRQVLRRAQCSGFGFEEPQQACPGPVAPARRPIPYAD